LRTSTSIDELKPSDGTALVICAQDDTTEHAVAQYPRYSKANAVALLVQSKRRLLLVKASGRHVVVKPRQQRCALSEAQLDYFPEIFGRDWTNCRLSASGNPALIIKDPLLDGSRRSAEGNRVREIEITSRFNQRQMHPANAWISGDLTN